MQWVEIHGDTMVRPGGKRSNIYMFNKYGELKEPVLQSLRNTLKFTTQLIKRKTYTWPKLGINLGRN